MPFYVKNKNRKTAYTSLLLSLGIVMIIIGWSNGRPTFAQSNTDSIRQIPISASLFDNQNRIISRGAHQVRFALYTVNRTTPDPYPSNSDTKIWEETQTVQVRNGVFRASLGAFTPFPASANFENGGYYIGIRMDQDSEMIPRKKLGSVPRAINSQYLQGKTIEQNGGNILTLNENGKIDAKYLPGGDKNLDLSKFLTSSDSLFDDLHEQNTDTGTTEKIFNIGSKTALGSNNFDLTVSSASNAPTLRYNAGIQLGPDDKALFANPDNYKKPEPPTPSKIEGGTDKIYWPKNFGIIILSDWIEVSPDKITLPKDMSGTEFAYQKKDTSCTFAYIRTPQSKLTYSQTSFATRVYTSEKDQLSASWYLYKPDLPENFTFKWEGRQPMKGEVRINHFPTSSSDNSFDKNYRNIFILYSDSGDIVPNECDKDVSLMLGSIYSKYENIKIDKSSNGVLYINQGYNKGPYFKFALEEEGSAKIISEVTDIRRDPNPTVFQGDFYFVSKNGDLQTMDIFSGEVKNVLDKHGNGEQIVNDYYFLNSNIYYLFGNDCNSYMAPCNLSLYEYSRDNKKSRLLIENLPYRNILGYSQNKDILYMENLFADAGAFWSKIESYSLSQNKSLDIREYRGDTMDDKSEFDKYTEFKKSFDNQLEIAEFLIVRNGAIIMPKKLDPEFSHGWWRIRYIN